MLYFMLDYFDLHLIEHEVKDDIGTARSASYVDLHLIEHEVKDAIGTARS
jgi:hypothetical protein